MKTFMILIGVLAAGLLVTTTDVQAAWISLEPGSENSEPLVRVLDNTRDYVLVEVTVQGLQLEETATIQGEFTEVAIPGESVTVELGLPATPRLLRLIGIPSGTSARVEVEAIETATLGDVVIMPAQLPQKDSTLNQDFVLNHEFYASSATYPETWVEVSEPKRWRDVSLVELSMFPVRYHASSRKLEIAHRLVVRIATDHSGAQLVPELDTVISPRYDRLYRSRILNYETMDHAAVGLRDSVVDYLIIAIDSLTDELQPLQRWHTQAGLRTLIVPLSQVGSTTTQIKAFIQNYYDQHAIEHILLVGEHADIPLCSVSQGGDTGIGDHDYVRLDGTDYYPDAGIGRFCTNQSTAVTHSVQRTLNYLREPPLDGWLDRTMMCAHEQEYPDKYTRCKNEIIAYPYSVVTPIFDTYYPPEGATKAQVIAAMVQGRNLVNYRGHGDVREWSWSIGWTPTDIASLNNGAHTPIVWNIACLNAAVDSTSECLSEAWMNAGSNGQGGAVANLGATRASYTVPNHDYDKQLYRAIYDEGVYLLGDVVNNAKAYTIPQGDYAIFNVRIYLIFGDPALEVYTRTPAQLQVGHNPTVPMGDSEFEVSVLQGGNPLVGATVCAWKEDEDFYEVQLSDATGVAHLQTALTSIGDLLLTVTAHDSLPYTATLVVEPAGCGAVRLHRNLYNCSDTASVTVWDADLNLNPAAIDTATVEMSSDSEPAGELMVLNETGNDTAEFSGSIQLSATQSGPGIIQVSHGDLLQATYNDQDCDGAPRTVSADSELDCEPPVLDNIMVVAITNDSARVHWLSDEMSDSQVRYGTTVPPTEIASDSHVTVTHAVTLSGLTEDTQYFFAVGAEDLAENFGENTNAGAYFQFHTRRAITVFFDTMETPLGWITTGDGQWEWSFPLGRGGGLFGGHPDPSHDHTSGFGKVWGVDLTDNGNYNAFSNCALISPPIFCSNIIGTRVEFYQWLNVSGNDLILKDAYKIEISTDNGASWSTMVNEQDGYYNDAWEQKWYDVSQKADRQPAVRFKFSLTSGPMFEDSGWNLDDFKVWGYDTGAGFPTPTPTPTWTTGPGTPTYTPQPPTRTPTPTATRTPTLTIEPTDTPSHPIPTATPNVTLTPEPTLTPAPTQPPITTGCRLTLNQNLFHADDTFLLTLNLWNYDVGVQADVFVLLDVVGAYYCWPSWCMVPEMDSEQHYLPYNHSSRLTVLDFIWPGNAGSFSDARFWAAMMRSGTYDLLGEVSMASFGWE